MRIPAILLAVALASLPYAGHAQGPLKRTLPAQERAAMEACMAAAGKDVNAALACARRLEDGTLLNPAKAPPTPAPVIPAEDKTPQPVTPTETQPAPPPPTEVPADAEERTEAERDYDALYGRDYDPVADPTLPTPVDIAGAYDPWERFNRRMHVINNAIDRTVAQPLALAYVRVVPRPVRLGIGNFFSNLGQPVTAVNSLLQGKPLRAAQSLGRFALNSTLGIGGVFDPASDAKLPHRNEDFGQTLGVWGWKRSRYVELPVFGPRTVRDVFGAFGDAPLSPLRQVEADRVAIPLQGLQLVDVRAQLLSTDALREGAEDDYALVRDAWSQRRDYQIFGDRQLDDDSGLPDYLREETNPNVPVDAIPVTLPNGG
jgi:phospholipid-binding lipoprotein MlaA